MTNENEFKDKDMVIYDLTTIKTGLEKDGNARCFLSRVSADAINVIKQQAAELEAAKKEIAELKSSREGWQLVPIEPTNEMILNGRKECEGASILPYHFYKAMLKAAPKPEDKKR